MVEVVELPPGVAISILAFLLSLVPMGLFLWFWYLRRQDRPVPPKLVWLALLGGMATVVPVYFLEEAVSRLWSVYWPSTAYSFHSALLPLNNWSEVVLTALSAWLIVATIEEGVRWLFLRYWIKESRVIDQVFDGLVIGVVTGLGFATLENTVYFWHLFAGGSWNTLVVVFFLRFLISTLAHTSFGGLMGALLARGTFTIYRPAGLLGLAFGVPWVLHGAFDFLLNVNLPVYAVLLLLAPLGVVVFWSQQRELLVVNRVDGRHVVDQRPPVHKQAAILKEAMQKSESPWNKFAPWLQETRQRQQLLNKLEQHD